MQGNLMLDDDGDDVSIVDGDGKVQPLTPLTFVAVANERRPKLPQTTEWFDGATAPIHVGWYERHFIDSVENLSEPRMHYWDGTHWRRTPIARIHDEQVGDYPAWRGLEISADQSAIPGLHWNRSGVWFEAAKAA